MYSTLNCLPLNSAPTFWAKWERDLNVHTFWLCRKIQPFWESVHRYLPGFTDKPIFSSPAYFSCWTTIHNLESPTGVPCCRPYLTLPKAASQIAGSNQTHTRSPVGFQNLMRSSTSRIWSRWTRVIGRSTGGVGTTGLTSLPLNLLTFWV